MKIFYDEARHLYVDFDRKTNDLAELEKRNLEACLSKVTQDGKITQAQTRAIVKSSDSEIREISVAYDFPRYEDTIAEAKVVIIYINKKILRSIRMHGRFFGEYEPCRQMILSETGSSLFFLNHKPNTAKVEK